MANMTTIEAKAFVPSRDFALSKQFYQDLGFEVAWSSDNLAYLRHGNSAFLLQNFYNKDHAGNFMMHLSPQDLRLGRLSKMRGLSPITLEFVPIARSRSHREEVRRPSTKLRRAGR